MGAVKRALLTKKLVKEADQYEQISKRLRREVSISVTYKQYINEQVLQGKDGAHLQTLKNDYHAKIALAGQLRSQATAIKLSIDGIVQDLNFEHVKEARYDKISQINRAFEKQTKAAHVFDSQLS